MPKGVWVRVPPPAQVKQEATSLIQIRKGAMIRAFFVENAVMDIVQEQVDTLNALLKIKVGPEDYKAKYDEALKTARKQVSIPGFRPGHVPMSVVKKQYGKSLLADEINKVLQDSIHKHIQDNDLHILGNPLPVEKAQQEGDWDNPSDFEFEYELGFAPEIDLKLEKKKATYYTIKVDDKLIDQQVDDLSKRYGSLSEPPEAGENDLLMGTFVQLNADGEILEGGIMNDGTIALEFVEDKKTKKAFTGAKKEDTIVIDPHKVSKGHDDLGKMLGITHEEVHHLEGNFQFKVNDIKHLTPSPVDQTLFDKVYGKDEVKDLDGFREKVKAQLENGFKRDQDWLFKRELSDEMINKVDPELPNEFLKKWIRMANENPISEEQVEADYPNYSRGLKWQLIEGKIARENELEIANEEIEAHVKQNIAAQYAQYGMDLGDEELTGFARQTLQNREEVRKIYDMLIEDKVISYCKGIVKVKEKDVSFDEFKKMIEKP